MFDTSALLHAIWIAFLTGALMTWLAIKKMEHVEYASKVSSEPQLWTHLSGVLRPIALEPWYESLTTLYENWGNGVIARIATTAARRGSDLGRLPSRIARYLTAHNAGAVNLHLMPLSLFGIKEPLVLIVQPIACRARVQH